MHPFVNMATKAARKAGDLIIHAQERVADIQISEKSKNNFVTEVDKAAEAEIIEILRTAYPNHAILAEESGEHPGTGDHQWIIDPLDGTTNFIHNYPHFCVSIALKIRGRVEHAVIYDPVKQDLYTASRGEGAFKNNRRIRVSGCNYLHRAMIGSVLPVSAVDHREQYFNALLHLSEHARSNRIAGAAALDLAYVASGQLDGFWSINLKPWDVAAGGLLIKEAGGVITDFNGNDDFIDSGNVIAGNVKVFKQLVNALKPYIQK